MGRVRDRLERHYTEDRLAYLCLCRLPSRHGTSPRVLEPTVGGGSFARSVRTRWRNATVVGVDLDPHAGGAEDCDSFVHSDIMKVKAEDIGDVDLIAGNLPFSPAPTILEHLFTFGATFVASILPLAIIEGGGAWERMMDEHPPQFVDPIRGRPWPKHVRGCGQFVWHGDGSPGDYKFRPFIRGWKA